METTRGTISNFLEDHFKHFNAAALLDASKAYCKHLENNGKMFLSMAGAMSTAELGRSLGEMIRKDKVHGICCTGANLEEDLFNLIAHEHYVRIPGYRELTAEGEKKLFDQQLNRVTDTCIPEHEAMRRLDHIVLEEWKAADEKEKSYFPHEYLYQVIRKGKLKEHYQIDPKNSWMVAASEKNLPLFVPGWEDSTLGNVFASYILRKILKHPATMKSGIETMMELSTWYQEVSREHSIGFFQIGGGIAGDFPICVVPMLEQDMFLKNVRKWGYFCQISDSTTSYGSYSGAVPNEKITWGKLDVHTPNFIIESDASIVAPLMFAYVLGW